MTTEAPEPSTAEEFVEAIRKGAVRTAASELIAGIKMGVRTGELGALPVILALVAIGAYFGLQSEHFLTARNMSNLVLQITVTGTIAIGVVLVLLLGEIDLSIGSVAGLCAAAFGVLLVNHGWPWWAAVVVLLLIGAAIGAFQGAWLAIIRVPSFVVTLAGLLAWLGVQLHILGETGTLNVFEPHIEAIANTFLPSAWGWIVAVGTSTVYAVARLTELARRRRSGLPAQPIAVVIAKTLGLVGIAFGAVAVLNRANGVPTAGLILLGLLIVFAWVTTRTRFGRSVYAVGGNAEAARRAGINIRRIRIYVFTLAASFAAVGGLITVSRGYAASTQTGGGTLLLEAIAAAVIGGTSLFGGRGNVWSALLGALVIGSVSNGLDLLGQPSDVKYIVQGAILLLAVTIDAASRRGRVAAGR
jgi:D-xylose transport system permease protein